MFPAFLHVFVCSGGLFLLFHVSTVSVFRSEPFAGRCVLVVPCCLRVSSGLMRCVAAMNKDMIKLYVTILSTLISMALAIYGQLVCCGVFDGVC